MNLVDELHAIAAALAAAGIPYAVCGGIAVTMHGFVRATKDIDILIAPEDLPRALEAVRPLGYAFPALPMTFQAGTERERHVQRVSKLVGKAHLALDLLLAEASFAGALEGRIEVVHDQQSLVVVSRDTLIRMKRLAGRPQDLVDIERLEGGEDDV